MAALTVLEKITIAKISEFLCAIAIRKGGLYGDGIPLDLPEKIYAVRKTIEYLYDQDPNDTSLVATSNYLYSLCRFNLQAQGIMGDAGIIAGIIARTSPNPYQFFVTSSSTPLQDGQSTVTLTSFIGYNLIFNRNWIPQGSVDPANGGSWYSWSRTTGILTVVPAVVTTEFIQLFPI